MNDYKLSLPGDGELNSKAFTDALTYLRDTFPDPRDAVKAIEDVKTIIKDEYVDEYVDDELISQSCDECSRNVTEYEDMYETVSGSLICEDCQESGLLGDPEGIEYKQ